MVASAVASLLAASLLSPAARGEDDQGNAPPIVVEVEGVVEAPVDVVRAVLLDLERFVEWFPSTSEWRVLSPPRDGSARVYGRQALPWPVRDRDYVVEYRWWDEAGDFVLRADAVRGAEPPATEDSVRVEWMETEWRISATPGGTAVRYRYLGDFGGRLPAFAARFAWRSRAPIVIERLRDQVERVQAERLPGPADARRSVQP